RRPGSLPGPMSRTDLWSRVSGKDGLQAEDAGQKLTRLTLLLAGLDAAGDGGEDVADGDQADDAALAHHRDRVAAGVEHDGGDPVQRGPRHDARPAPARQQRADLADRLLTRPAG